ncbi:hypothetical protein IB75_04420 [Nitrosococcus oceani C-27]|uniref:Uncharacterized protein n=1 Tax=Nitrosococcus oceani C-27 TaxID=314279 RepID=A0A0E2Z952_9GAMM|nr:hypothetical protein IB75_04420 [Nitrosococcus oceani C-27]
MKPQFNIFPLFIVEGQICLCIWQIVAHILPYETWGVKGGVRFIFRHVYPVIHAGRGANFRKAVDVSKLRRITLVTIRPFYTRIC